MAQMSDSASQKILLASPGTDSGWSKTRWLHEVEEAVNGM